MEESKLNDLLARHSGIMLDIGCGKDAVQGVNNFYWCEEHLPKRFRNKKTG